MVTSNIHAGKHDPDVIPYVLRRKLRQQHGPAAEAVLDVMAQHHSNEGIEISHASLATEAGISVSMTRRTVEKLCESSWLKCEHQIRDSRQVVNRYQIPTHVLPDRHGRAGVQGEHPGVLGEQAPSINTQVGTGTSLLSREVLLVEENIDIQEKRGGGGEAVASQHSSPEDSEESFRRTDVDRTHEARRDHRDLVVDNADVEEVGARSARIRRIEALGARCARNAHAKKNYFIREERRDYIAEVLRLRIEHATGREIRSEQRLQGFRTSARILLLHDGHRYDEIVEMIGFVADEGLMSARGSERIVNLKQIRDQWDYLQHLKGGGTKNEFFGNGLSLDTMTADKRASLRRKLENHTWPA